jgi:hypothetical protein
MKTSRVFLLSLTCIFVYVGCSRKTGCKDLENKTDSIDEIDYQIYSLVLPKIHVNANTFVVKQRILKINFNSKNIDPEHYNELFKQVFPDLSKTVLNDYKKENSTTVSLENKFFVSPKAVKLITEEERNSIFSGQNLDENWNNFHAKYPDSKGLICLSRIGYNSCRTEAVFEISISVASENAEGLIVLLKKIDDVWKILKIHQTWIS